MDVVRGRQDGCDDGVVRGVPVHGIGGAPRRPSAGVIRRQAGRSAATRRRWPTTGDGWHQRRGVAVPGEARHARAPFRARARRPPPAAGRPRPGRRRALRRSVSWPASHRVISLSRSRGRGWLSTAPVQRRPRRSSPRPPAARRAPARVVWVVLDPPVVDDGPVRRHPVDAPPVRVGDVGSRDQGRSVGHDRGGVPRAAERIAVRAARGPVGAFARREPARPGRADPRLGLG